jgi:hypothetical protein
MALSESALSTEIPNTTTPRRVSRTNMAIRRMTLRRAAFSRVAFIRAALKRLALNREDNQQNGVWHDNIQLSDARQNGTRLNDTQKKGHSADHTKYINRVTLIRITIVKMLLRRARFNTETPTEQHSTECH